GPTVAAASNASETGDPYVNNLTLTPNPPAGGTVPVPAPGTLPPITYGSGLTARTGVLTNSVANVYWPGANAATAYDSAGAATPIPGGNNAYLGANGGGGGGGPDSKQHPYWRSEQLQRVLNLTTVRTHQYAVWITVGFFEVLRQGDISMIASANPDK